MYGQYLKNQKSKKTLVLIHGWCCDSSHFKKQIDAFKSKFNIYCANYSELVKTYDGTEDNIFFYCANKIQEEISQLELHNLYFIGHSLGGNIALMLANTLERETIGSVIIDTTMPMSSKATEKFNTFFSNLVEKDFSAQERMVREFIESKCNTDYDSKNIIKTIVDGMMLTWKTNSNQFNRLGLANFKFDSSAALKKLRGPLMYIAATPPSGNLKELLEIKKTIDIQKVLSGHFVMITQHAKTNELLTNFLMQESSRPAD